MPEPHDHEIDESGTCSCGSDLNVVVEVGCEDSGVHIWQQEIGWAAADNAGVV